MKLRLLVVVPALVIGLLYAVVAGRGDPVLDTVIQGTKIAHETATFKGVVTRDNLSYNDAGLDEHTRGVYTIAYDRGKFRVDLKASWVSRDMSKPYQRLLCPTVHSDGITLTEYEAGTKWTGSWAATRSVAALLGDPLDRASKNAWMPGEVCMFAIPATDAKHAVRIVGSETIAGSDCAIVETRDSDIVDDVVLKYRSHSWICPSKGFATLKWQSWQSRGESTEEVLIGERISSVRQYEGGAWGPAEVKETAYIRDGKGGRRIDYEHITSFASDCKINRPIDEADLRFVLPSGEKVLNHDTGEWYTAP